jgi:hypothetical protein
MNEDAIRIALRLTSPLSGMRLALKDFVLMAQATNAISFPSVEALPLAFTVGLCPEHWAVH